MEEKIDRLEEIQTEMLELLEEADEIIRDVGEGSIYERAKSYWLAHVRIAITKDHGYVAGSMCDMEDTLDELRDLAIGCEFAESDGPEDVAVLTRR